MKFNPGPDGTLMADPVEVVPQLAESWTVDGPVITFKLRPGVKFFATGNPMTSEDVRYSFERLTRIVGNGRNQAGIAGLFKAEQVEAVDPMTVRITFTDGNVPTAVPVALTSMKFQQFAVIDSVEVKKHATADDPYGTKWLETKTVESGAFVIETWQKGAMMSLVPNPHAFQPSKLERIILQVVPDASTRRIVLERGDVDFAVQIATKDIPDLRKVSGVRVASYPSARGWFLGMTWNKAPFNNIHFRRAMAWAMPYETILQVVTHGLAERARSCVPNNISGYVGDLWPYETNLDKARQELAQAQVPDGFAVTIPVYAGDLFDEEATVLIKESLAQLGLTLTLQKMPISQKRSLMTQKQVDMAVYDWRPWVPDAGYFIYWNWLPDSFTNYWNYTNTEAQALGNEAITMVVGSPERNAKLRRFQEIVNGDIGLVPLFNQFDNIVMRENVQGYVYYPDTVPVLAKMSLG